MTVSLEVSCKGFSGSMCNVVYNGSFPQVVQSLYTRSESLVRIAGSKSDSFQVRVGCQGSSLSINLFITEWTGFLCVVG